MGYQAVFQRYELKYLLTTAQKERMVAAMSPYLGMDEYGRTTIRNLYYDTDNYRLIRRSLDAPAYKEKLRLRSYAQAGPDSPVFVELKKKCRGVVFKRRLCMPQTEAVEFLRGGPGPEGQIAGEIGYFRQFYGTPEPKVFLSYEREAYWDGGDFRVTFDDNILFRQTELSLEAPVYGKPLLPDGMVLMEIKCVGAMPLWMARLLSKEGIYKTSYSKYGTAYLTMLAEETVPASQGKNVCPVPIPGGSGA